MFFILPVGVDYTARRYPMVTFTLMGINVVVYLISVVVGVSAGEPGVDWLIEHLWLIPKSSSLSAYFTSMFVHAGIFHLLGNMIYLFLFGSAVEDKIGRWQYVLFYLAGGLAADLAHIIATPGHFSSMVALGGASGAVSACLGGFLVLFHRTRINFRYFVFILIRFWTGEFALPAWLVISFWFLKDLGSAVLSAAGEEEGGGVAFAAHVGGTLAGLALVGWVRIRRRLLSQGGDEEQPEGERPAEPASARMPEAEEIPSVYLYANGVEHGPFTVGQVLQMLELGSLGEETCYWREGMTEWRPVGELRESGA